MKTKVEVDGYEIEIEVSNGVITVKAEKDNEVIEEFSIETNEQEESQDEIQDEVQGFEEFDTEEEDFDGEELQNQEEEEEEEDEDESALESFQSFINKRK